MSRNRYDRDDDEDYYGGNSRERSSSGSSGANDDYRYGSQRTDYGRGSNRGGRDMMDYSDDDSHSTRAGRGTGGASSYGREEDYGRGRYNERSDYGYDESRYDSSSGRGWRGGDERDQEGRSLFEEGRDYLQQKFGGRASSGRGPSRSRLRCRDIMTRDVTVAMRDTTLVEVAAMMREEDTGVIPVVENQSNPTAASTGKEEAVEEARKVNNRIYGNGRLVGLITDRDIVIRALAEGKDPRTTRVEEIMTTDVHTVKPNDRVLDAIRKMGDKQVRRIPVVGENGNLRGIISMADVALETEDDRELAGALEEISSGSSFWGKIFS